MTDIIEVRARRSSPTGLSLTVFDHNLDSSELDRLEAVLDKRDSRARRLGVDIRLRGYALGLLIDCAARNQLGSDKADRAHAFITDFVRHEYLDPNGDYEGEVFDPASFDIPDDGETTPESAFVLDHFVARCDPGPRHDPDPARTAAAYEAANRNWRQVPDDARRRFQLELEGVPESLVALFEGETWWTAYTL